MGTFTHFKNERGSSSRDSTYEDTRRILPIQLAGVLVVNINISTAFENLECNKLTIVPTFHIIILQVNKASARKILSRNCAICSLFVKLLVLVVDPLRALSLYRYRKA